MATTDEVRILVVEDEKIVALDLQSRLESMGYAVAGRVSTGRQAVESAVSLKPDVVLMDIMLQGEMDGVSAAEEIRTHLDVPIVYLTAYSDGETLERAKQTEPSGYLLKPFTDRDLNTTIEISRHRHDLQRRLKQNERWLGATLNSIGEAVIVVDEQARVVRINPRAEALTGWTRRDALEQSIAEVCKFVDETSRQALDNLMTLCLRDGQVFTRENEAILVARDGTEVFIDETASPIYDREGNLLGGVLVIRDATSRKFAEEQFRLEMIPVVLDTLGALVVVLNGRGRIVRFNRASQDLTGFGFEEIRGRNFWDLAADEYEALEIREAFEAVRRGDNHPRHCNSWRTRTGTVCKIAWTHGAILGEDGTFKYDICTGVPIDFP